MTEDQTQTAATETDDQAKPDTEDKGAQKDDLDQVLSEFDEKTAGSEDKPEQTAKPEDTDAIARVERLERQIRETQTKSDLASAAIVVRGDLDSDRFDDATVIALMDAEARKDERISRAFLERDTNPKQYQRVLEGLSRKIAEKFTSLPDKGVTEDLDAVAQAVRSSGKAPEGKAPDYSKMSDTEFREAVEKEHGFSPL